METKQLTLEITRRVPTVDVPTKRENERYTNIFQYPMYKSEMKHGQELIRAKSRISRRAVESMCRHFDRGQKYKCLYSEMELEQLRSYMLLSPKTRSTNVVKEQHERLSGLLSVLFSKYSMCSEGDRKELMREDNKCQCALSYCIGIVADPTTTCSGGPVPSFL